MKEYTCKYCNITYQFDIKQQFGWHVANCQKNLNKRIYTSSKKQHVVNCIKCNKQYNIIVTDQMFNSKKYTKYCSRSCANKRYHSNQAKNNISNGVKNSTIKHKYTCKTCNTIFFAKTNNNIYCSDKCRPVTKQSIVKICKVCNKQFSTKKTIKTICSSCLGKQIMSNQDRSIL